MGVLQRCLVVCLILNAGRSPAAEPLDPASADGHPWVLEAYTVPVLDVWADKDAGERNEGVELDADLDSGNGYALRLAYGGSELDPVDPDFTASADGSLGLFYLSTRHTDLRDRSRVHADLVLVDAALEFLVAPWLTAHVGAGVGALLLDHSAYSSRDSGAAFMLRGGLGWHPVPRAALQAGLGWFYWGYPGETIGQGLFLQAGGLLRF